jgi:cyanophycinase
MSEKKEVASTRHQSGLPVPKGKLLAIGGKEVKGGEKTEPQKQNIDFLNLEILGRFVQELKGSNPRVAIIPTASSVPEESAQDYIEVFEKLQVNYIKKECNFL